MLEKTGRQQAETMLAISKTYRDAGLSAISLLCQIHGATIIIAHHNSKSSNVLGRTPDLDDLSWSGFAELARQWILVSRNKAYGPMTVTRLRTVTKINSQRMAKTLAELVNQGVIQELPDQQYATYRLTTLSN